MRDILAAGLIAFGAYLVSRAWREWRYRCVLEGLAEQVLAQLKGNAKVKVDDDPVMNTVYHEDDRHTITTQTSESMSEREEIAVNEAVHELSRSLEAIFSGPVNVRVTIATPLDDTEPPTYI